MIALMAAIQVTSPPSGKVALGFPQKRYPAYEFRSLT